MIHTREMGASVLLGMRNSGMDEYDLKFLVTCLELPKPVVYKKRQKGTANGGAKSHRKNRKTPLQGITAAAIRKIARRGGCKRMSGLVYDVARNVLKEFLCKLIKDTVHYTECAKRNTVTSMDVLMALKRQGRYLYGFN